MRGVHFRERGLTTCKKGDGGAREVVRSTSRHVLVPGEFRKDATTASRIPGEEERGREGVERGR